MTRKIRYAMVGGGLAAFIGAVHRLAANLDGQYELVAGALYSTPVKAKKSGEALGLAPERAYGTWEELLFAEKKRPDGAEVIVIVTPNHLHFPVALAAVQAGYHVICDKPLVTEVAQAHELARAVDAAGNVFGVTYNYSGYLLIRQARHKVRAGDLGELRRVTVEYHQGRLARRSGSERRGRTGGHRHARRAITRFCDRAGN